jgi:sec-independent protein translocase protein TatA
MFDTLGVPELLIILVIVALLFGVGRVSSLGKELGTAISEFRKGLRDDDSPEQVANSANEIH